MEKYFLYGFIALGILLIICLVFIYILYGKLSEIKKRQMRLSEKLSGKKAEDLMYDIINDNIKTKKEIQNVIKELNDIRYRQSRCFDKVNIVRYHTTSDNEAKLSYSVGLSNENGDGLIITGLQYRQGCNMYYKQIKEGIPDYKLSEEEMRALDRSNAADVIGNRGW